MRSPTPREEFEWEKAKEESFAQHKRARLVAFGAMLRGDKSFLDLPDYESQKAWIANKIAQQDLIREKTK